MVTFGRVVGARLGRVQYAFATVDLNLDVEFKVDRGCVGDEVGAVGFGRLYRFLAGLFLDWFTVRLGLFNKTIVHCVGLKVEQFFGIFIASGSLFSVDLLKLAQSLIVVISEIEVVI